MGRVGSRSIAKNDLAEVVRVAKEAAIELHDSCRLFLLQTISQGVESEELRSVATEGTSRVLLSKLSWMMRWFKHGRGRIERSFAATCCGILLAGIGDPQAPPCRPCA